MIIYHLLEKFENIMLYVNEIYIKDCYIHFGFRETLLQNYILV